MAKVLQHRRGTSSEHTNFTGAAGEITFDTTAKRLVAHDGTTKGGIPVATKQEVEQVANSLDPRILDAASQADILEAVGQVTGGGSVSQPTLEGLQSQISANTSNIGNKLGEDDREKILAWVKPDYSAGVAISSGYVAPKSGVVVISGEPHSSEPTILYIDGTKVFKNHSSYSGTITDGAGQALVGQGSVVTYSGHSTVSAVFYPFE